MQRNYNEEGIEENIQEQIEEKVEEITVHKKVCLILNIFQQIY